MPSLLTAALQQELVGAGLGWRLEEVAVRIVRQSGFRPEDADDLLGLVVVGSDVLVADRPVETEPIGRLWV